MSDKSAIEWTEATWNPIKGCSRISPGCQNCYAERMAARFSDPGQPYEGLARFTTSGPRWTGKLSFDEITLRKPLHWKKPKMIFVNSMSDLFHEGVEEGGLAETFSIMASCPQHTFQILTKRARRMHSFLRDGHESVVSHDAAVHYSRRIGIPSTSFMTYFRQRWTWPIPNVWLGVSVENQETADERIPLLLQTPAAVRFISCEPLLGPIDITKYIYPWAEKGPPPLDWIIVGAESGPGARPMELKWARDIVSQCKDNGTPVFVKQLCNNGHKIPFEQWPEELKIRQWPKR